MRLKRIKNMKLWLIALLPFLFLNCVKQAEIEQTIKAVKFEELETVYTKQNDTLYVVNYWATWCVPCVEEIPHFMELNAEYSKNHKFEMILVSLDKLEVLNTSVQALITKKNIVTDVYLLDDIKRMNDWIPAVNEDWSGAIPATVLYKNGKQLAFHEGKLNKEELQELIQQNL
jgi:thiol-disulfide isomerase/thioredoxin